MGKFKLFICIALCVIAAVFIGTYMSGSQIAIWIAIAIAITSGTRGSRCGCGWRARARGDE